MLKQNKIVLIFPYFDTLSTVLQFLKEYGVDADKRRDDDSLIVMDAVEKFFGTAQDFAHFLSLSARRLKALGKNGVAAIIDVSVFDHEPVLMTNRVRLGLAEYEDEIGIVLNGLKKQGLDVQVICCYHRNNYLSKLTEHQRLKLWKSHNASFNVTSNGRISIEKIAHEL